MVLDSEIHKFQIGLDWDTVDWDCCYFRKLLFTIIFMSQILISRFQILTMLGKVHHTTNIYNHITVSSRFNMSFFCQAYTFGNGKFKFQIYAAY